MTALAELELGVPYAMLADRHRLRRRLQQLQAAQAAGKPIDAELHRWQTDLEKSQALLARREAERPAVTYDESLPIAAKREQIAAAIKDHQVVVVCGETGSGKSTQLPKILLDLGLGVAGLIGHTQPRRIAARSIASRVAEELKAEGTKAVGYKIRFTDSTSDLTYIKLMTDGVLLAESQQNRFLDAYEAIIIDEAHERSLNIDFLLGYLKQLLPRRRDLKLIITSATLDAQRFSEHFAGPAGNAPVIEVSGRTYPVEMRWRPLVDAEDDDPDWQSAVVEAVAEATAIDRGDVLIFAPTERDVHETAKALRGWLGPQGEQNTEILPLYARLSTGDQQRVFEPHGKRRIVVATNVAESSLTVPGVRFVIDPGTARVSRYAARSKMQRLPIEPISQASADQRAGRCGRVGPGVCIRLYSEEDYQKRDRYTSPEIQRTNLASVVLQLKSLRFGEIEDFPFLDPPRLDAIRDGYHTLFELGAIDSNRDLTPIGRKLARLPVDPRVGRMILAGDAEGCLHDVLVIASLLEVQDPRERPVEKRGTADELHARFADPESDFMGVLKLWDFYEGLKESLSRNKLRTACKQNFLSHNRMREWVDVFLQLREIVEDAGMKVPPRKNDYNAIHRALLTGLLSNVAYKSDDGNEYSVAGGQKMTLWPGSSILSKKPKWIAAAELVETTRRYLRTAARIDPAWIEPLAAHLVNRSYSDPHWVSERGTVMGYEKVTLFGLVVVPKRRVHYGPIDPLKAREIFIEHGLVQGDLKINAPFLTHNRRLMEEMENLQAKLRRRDLLRGEMARYEFYNNRIPADVFDVARLEAWRKTAEAVNPKILFMSAADLAIDDAVNVSPESYPDKLPTRQATLPLEYRLEPGSEADGVTVVAPAESLNQLDPHRLGWLVPGLVEEKVGALIKSLPKELRKLCVPAPETARRVAEKLSFGDGNFPAAVARELSRLTGERIGVESFQLDKLPDHLRMNIRVVDPQGKTLAAGRDLRVIQDKLGADASQPLTTISDDRWSRDGVRAWDFGDLPPLVEIKRGATTVIAYPALIDEGDSASLRLVDSAERAAVVGRAGVRRLFALAVAKEVKTQLKWVPKFDACVLWGSHLPDGKRLASEIADLLVDRAFLDDEPLPKNAVEFQQRLKRGRERMGLALQDVGKMLEPTFNGFFQLRVAFEKAIPAHHKPAYDDVRLQVERLAAPGFLTRTSWEWLQHYPRYLKAVLARLEKLPGNVAKDKQILDVVRPRQQQAIELAKRQEELGIIDPELTLYRWMLEEFRVSVFAQTLGTAVSVSEKRLDKQWEKVRRVA